MRVLVADNDPEALDLLVLDLRLEGHVVTGASSGGEALARMADFAPDVAVLDYRMPPGPTGVDVAASARALWPGVRMILYTNYQDAEIVRRARELDMEFLAKGHLRALRALVSAPVRRRPDGADGATAPVTSHDDRREDRECA
jgi:CheY-like chemotaxis protein